MTGLSEEGPLAAAFGERRAVLGDFYVDRALADQTEGAQDFQEFITATAWGTWARGVLSRRERSILVLGLLAGLNRSEEFRLHLMGARNNGLSHTELNEIVIQITGYAGVPAGVEARRALVGLIKEEATADQAAQS